MHETLREERALAEFPLLASDWKSPLWKERTVVTKLLFSLSACALREFSRINLCRVMTIAERSCHRIWFIERR
jgi:hypothetical protein